MASGKKKSPGSQKSGEYRGGLPSSGATGPAPAPADDWLFDDEGQAAPAAAAPVQREAPAEPVAAPPSYDEPAPVSSGSEVPETPAETPLDDSDELKPRTTPAGTKPAFAGVSRKDLISSVIVLAVLLTAGLILVVKLLSNGPVSEEVVSDRRPDLPLEGNLVTISTMNANWRMRRPQERVGDIEVLGAAEGKAPPSVLPQIKFKIDPEKSKTGFVRFLFYFPDNRIAGSSVTVKVEGGRPVAGNEVRVSGDEVEINCSQGILNENAFLSYAGDMSVQRWRVEVSEASDYSAGDSQWALLSRFDMSDTLERP